MVGAMNRKQNQCPAVPTGRRSFATATGVLLLLVSVALFLPACRQAPSPGSAGANELIVSAAVSLKEAFNEIAALNEKRTGTKIHFNYGASGSLQKQIESGAPADVFASAGAKQMDDLAAKGF